MESLKKLLNNEKTLRNIIIVISIIKSVLYIIELLIKWGIL